MRRRKINAFLAIALTAGLAALALVYVTRSPQPALSDENPATGGPYEPGPYGAPPDQIRECGEWASSFDVIKFFDPVGGLAPKSPPPLKPYDLPPLRPPLASGERHNPDGSVYKGGSLEDLAPDMQEKIDALRNRRFPWNAPEEKEN